MTAWLGRASSASTSSGRGGLGTWGPSWRGSCGYDATLPLVVVAPDDPTLRGGGRPAQRRSATGGLLASGLVRWARGVQRGGVRPGVGQRLVALDVGPPGGGVAGHRLEPLPGRRLKPPRDHPLAQHLDDVVDRRAGV